ncbi:MAG: ABC transporter ATP-binding protein [Proteobacteria bacterium]|nr:ABC transporter ATP-binding protein [Pseudomonadota bacterium]
MARVDSTEISDRPETPEEFSAGANRFLEDEVLFSGRFSRNVFATLYASFYPFRFRVLWLLVLGFLGRLCLLSSANVIGYWADSLCLGSGCRPIPKIFMGLTNLEFVRVLILIALLGLLMNTVFRVAISRTGARAVSILYDEVTLRTSRLPISFFDVTPVGRMIGRFGSDYGAIFRMAGGPLGEFLCLVFDLIVMVLLMVYASHWFSIVVLLLILLNFVAYRWNNPRLRRERREQSRIRGPAIGHFAETVQGVAPIKAYGKSETFTRRFHRLLNDLLVQRMRATIAVHVYSLQMSAIVSAALLGTGSIGILMLRGGQVSVGDLGVAFTFIMMTSTTIQQFFEWLANIEEALTGVERLDNYLRRPLEPGMKLPALALFEVGQPKEGPSAGVPLEGASGTHIMDSQKPAVGVSFQAVTLRYRSDLPDILQDVSFDVRPGEHFAIVGRTGSGKSTVIQALFALYQPQSGVILVDGMAADTGQDSQSKIPLRSYRRTMALIPQEPILFRGSLRDNLVIHDPFKVASDQVSDEKIWDILQLVGVKAWVEKLNSNRGQGLDYFVEERGANLSSGERQIMCMVRAILLNTPIIIMDEATSAIDSQSEEMLMHSMQVLLRNKTRIVVAHRPSTIAQSDRVMWLDQGRVRMIGSFRDLPLDLGSDLD